MHFTVTAMFSQVLCFILKSMTGSLNIDYLCLFLKIKTPGKKIQELQYSFSHTIRTAQLIKPSLPLSSFHLVCQHLDNPTWLQVSNGHISTCRYGSINCDIACAIGSVQRKFAFLFTHCRIQCNTLFVLVVITGWTFLVVTQIKKKRKEKSQGFP